MDNYRRVYAKIDLDALRYNVRNIREKIGNEKKLMLIIKADAYGHGANVVAKALENEAVDAFGVAIIEEAVLLRKNGVKKPILILGYTDESQYEELIKNDITQTVFSYDMAEKLNETAVKLQKKAKINIKMDTGMRRIGFQPTEESIEIIKQIQKLEWISMDGIFTHFARADEKDKTDAKEQFQRFQSFVEECEKEQIHFETVHCANSAAIMEMPQTYCDQVRSGIITYGLYPSKEVDKEKLQLRPLMELKTRIVFLKEVGEGIGVSYNHIYKTSGPTKIATIPVGYADGYPRSLSSKGRVLVHGQFAPIIGRVCMDQFMIDVTNIKDVRIGDEVTLVGRDGDQELLVEEVADLSGSFNYEFVCDIGKRVPRVYIENGKEVKTVDYLVR